MIHELANVATTDIGPNTIVWQYAIILEGAQIGDYCNINCHTFIENNVVIGNHVTIKSGVYLWDGIQIENNVFIGPNVTFTNDLIPRSKKHRASTPTFINEHVSIGANCSILAGTRIGKYAMVGMSTIVTKDVPDYGLVYGNPATIKGWVNKDGSKMKHLSLNNFLDSEGNEWQAIDNKLLPK